MPHSPEDWEDLRRKLRYKVAFHVGNFCPDLEDLVQETLARYQKALQQNLLRKPESRGSFLSGICNNVIAEYRRRLWRETPYEPTVHQPEPVAPEAEMLEMRDTIEEVLAQLGDRDRLILREFYLEGRDKEDICRETGLTDPQFRLIIHRAKERCRKILDGSMKHGDGERH